MAKVETVETGLPAGKPKRRKKTFKKRGEKRVVHHGVVHVQASFNNTIITITDNDGAVLAWSSAGGIGFKGVAQGHPVRRDAGGDQRRARSEGVRPANRGRAGEGTGSGARIGDSGAPDLRRAGDKVDSRRHADSAQRVSPAEAASSLSRGEAWHATSVRYAGCAGGKA